LSPVSITLGGPGRSYDGVTTKVLLASYGKLKGAPLAHVTREVIRRQAAGKLADGSMTAAAIAKVVTVPTQAACKAHLAELEKRRKASGAAKKN
jgi:hypothetical protein